MAKVTKKHFMQADAGKLAHKEFMRGIEWLMMFDPPKHSSEGKLLYRVSKAVEQYEKATLPPPAGKKIRRATDRAKARKRGG